MDMMANAVKRINEIFTVYLNPQSSLTAPLRAIQREPIQYRYSLIAASYTSS